MEWIDHTNETDLVELATFRKALAELGKQYDLRIEEFTIREWDSGQGRMPQIDISFTQYKRKEINKENLLKPPKD